MPTTLKTFLQRGTAAGNLLFLGVVLAVIFANPFPSLLFSLKCGAMVLAAISGYRVLFINEGPLPTA